LVEYTPDGATTPVKDLKMICERYIYSLDFLIDLVALFPFVNIFTFVKFGRENLFFTFKLLRIRKGIKMLDGSKLL
jgi:hypothetical protein